MTTEQQNAWIARVLGVHSGVLTGNGADPPPGGMERGKLVALQKSRLAWDAARKRVASEIEAFKQEVHTGVEGDPDADAFIDALDDLDDILLNLDDNLLQTLDGLLQRNDDLDAREDLLAEARQIVDAYQAYVASEPLVARLAGKTPGGLSLTVGPTIAATLKALRAQLN